MPNVTSVFSLKRLPLLLLAFLFAFSLLRLARYVDAFGRESIQMDFAPYYTAGETLNHGLSPYKTYVTQNPPIWDGIMFYKHSRFSYPPPAAIFFRPWAYFSYAVSKRVWMAFSLLCVIGALILSFQILKVPFTPTRILLVGIFAALFHPLLILLERGQIDAFTLLLIMISFKLMLKKGNGERISGAVLSLATLFKLHALFILPFLVWRKKWKALQGFFVGAAALFLISLVCNGAAVTHEYAFEHFPTMAKYGTDQGSKEQRLSVPLALTLLNAAPKDMRIKDGTAYKLSALSFAYNATLVRVFQEWFSKRGMNVSHQVYLALGTLLAFFSAMTFFLTRNVKNSRVFSDREEFMYGMAVLGVVLLSAPTTFVMNAVWLLPLSVLALSLWSEGRAARTPAFFLLAAGLLIVAATDFYSFSVPAFFQTLIEYKYVLGELMIVVALSALLKKSQT